VFLIKKDIYYNESIPTWKLFADQNSNISLPKEPVNGIGVKDNLIHKVKDLAIETGAMHIIAEQDSLGQYIINGHPNTIVAVQIGPTSQEKLDCFKIILKLKGII
jgi:hypothetical protein